MAIGSPEFSKICIVAPIWRYMNAGNLKQRRGLYPFCTNTRIIFLGSASLKLPFNIIAVLVQTRYHGDKKPSSFENLHCRPIWRYMIAGNLKHRRGLNPFCTNPRIIFLGSASLKLPFITNIALMQTRYHGERKPRNFGNLHYRPYMVIHKSG